MALLTLLRGAARRDRARLQRARQRAGDRRRRARHVRRSSSSSRASSATSRSARAARTRPGDRRCWRALTSRAAPARRGARRLRAHLRLVPRRLPARSSTATARTSQRALFLATLPVLLGVRYVALRRSSGSTGASGGSPAPRDVARDRGARRAVSVPSRSAIVAATRALGDFPLEIFVVDALLCTVLVGGSRLALRAAARARRPRRRGEPRARPRSSAPDGRGRSARARARARRRQPRRRLPRRQPGAAAARGSRRHGAAAASTRPTHAARTTDGPTRCSSRSRTPRRSASTSSSRPARAAGIACRFVRREIETAAVAAEVPAE